MKKKIVLTLVLIVALLCGNIANFNNNVKAAGTPKLTVNFKADTIDLKTKNKLYINISLTGVENIDTSKPLAMSANADYNSTLLANPTIKGGEGWSAVINNNKIVLDCASFTANKTIATITLDVKNSITSETKTKVSLTNVEVSDGDNYNAKFNKIESETITIGATKTSTDTNTEKRQTAQGTESENESSKQTDEQTKKDSDKEKQTNEQNKKDSEKETKNAEEKKDTSLQNNSEKKAQKVNTIEPIKDATTSSKPIPQAGAGITIFVVIGILLVIGIYTFVRDKKFYD